MQTSIQDETSHFGVETVASVVSDLSGVFGVGFRVCAPSRSNPHYMIFHEDRVVAAIERVEPLYLQSGGVWSGVEGEPAILPEEKLREIQVRAAAAARIPEGRVVPILWMVQGIPDATDEGNPQVVCSSTAFSLDEPVRAGLARAGAAVSADASTEVCRAYANAASMAAVRASGRSGGKLVRLLDAFEVILSKPEALGGKKVFAFGSEVSAHDIADPAFLLPAIAMAAHEDWRVATKRRTNGTGFTIRMDYDPKSLLGFRVTDIHPAVPFVAIAPMIACLNKLQSNDDKVVLLDPIVEQFRRWVERNDLVVSVFTPGEATAA